MKIGILSDIHGNIDALEKVSEQLKREGIKTLIVLGDIVGYYYHPKEIMEWLNDFQFYYVRGNHEEILGKLLENEIDPNDIKNKYGSGHEIALNSLSHTQLDFLIKGNDSINIEIEGYQFNLNHGAPFDKSKYLYPDSSKNLMEQCYHKDADFILFGHSHYSFIHQVKHNLIINPGSIGQNRQQGGIAQWVVFHSENGNFECRSTPYDTTRLIQEAKKTDPDNAYLYQILKRNN